MFRSIAREPVTLRLKNVDSEAERKRFFAAMALIASTFPRTPTDPGPTAGRESKGWRRKFLTVSHIRLDPPGFALESFDPIGAWREQDARTPIDDGGEWGGARFDGPAEFKRLLVGEPQEFTRGFVEHLLRYALSRGLEIHDMPAVREIQRAAEADGWKFIAGIAKSYPFTHVRTTN